MTYSGPVDELQNTAVDCNRGLYIHTIVNMTKPARD